MSKEICAFVAQRKSVGLRNRKLWVQSPSEANFFLLSFFFFLKQTLNMNMKMNMKNNVDYEW